ncbi:hypothetical protein HNY73_002857 [Argiope bruennichi]|uniref:Uncharacterized protein n=1 Tax=Argiope bruennichi TaxID=94029 RepID=A0A8T0FXP4_ARGBR|nr:hypothetical protein HNY73_002857 [Argiope bruennichi]
MGSPQPDGGAEVEQNVDITAAPGMYHVQEFPFLSRIITGNETWCHHFEPESRRQSQQWKHMDSPPPKKSKAVHASSGIVMMTFLFDCEGPLLIEFQENGATINAQWIAKLQGCCVWQVIANAHEGQI